MPNKGFTLIEILIVIGILAILATAIILAINPPRQFAQARNTQRWSNVNNILDAIYQNAIENRGIFTCVAGTLPSSATPMKVGVGGYDICACLVPTFLGSMPFDPSASGAAYTDCNTYDTGYTVMQNATSSRVTIAAPTAEIGAVISVTR